DLLERLAGELGDRPRLAEPAVIDRDPRDHAVARDRDVTRWVPVRPVGAEQLVLATAGVIDQPERVRVDVAVRAGRDRNRVSPPQLERADPRMQLAVDVWIGIGTGAPPTVAIEDAVGVPAERQPRRQRELRI